MLSFLSEKAEFPGLNPVITIAKSADAIRNLNPTPKPELSVALLTGCQDRSYAFGLAMALSSIGIQVDIIGNGRVDSPEFHTSPNLAFFDLGGIQQHQAGFSKKSVQLLAYYVRLLRYVASAQPKLLHILWNSKLEFFDRTLFMVYCKLLGKRIALTVHNVNRGKRDDTDSLLNRLTLRIQYRLADHIFVHTAKMGQELVEDFGVAAEAITKIPFPLNIAVPHTILDSSEAKRRLGIQPTDKTVLFFGRIAPYKGLDFLLEAFQTILPVHPDYRLIVAGEPMPGYDVYMSKVRDLINKPDVKPQIVEKLEFIPDEDAELYFKAADVVVLPYKDIFQSGVLFLGYSFGLPAIAANVGSFQEDIVEAETGFLYRPGDSSSLAATIEKFFRSDLYNELGSRRAKIRDQAKTEHSWETVGELTRICYERLSA